MPRSVSARVRRVFYRQETADALGLVDRGERCSTCAAFARRHVRLGIAASDHLRAPNGRLWAVSHQIRGLEDRLGARLFERGGGTGGTRVTAAGQRLLVATREALALLEDACSEIRGSSKELIISATPSFSTMWLASRLAQFSARHPQTPLNAVQEKEPSLSRQSVDLIIINVKAAGLGPGDTVLFRARVFPVCSPALHPIATRAIDQCRLLQEAHEDSPEIDWGSWGCRAI